jgi:16S rRNA (guanine1516-N2)-methyltransferase
MTPLAVTVTAKKPGRFEAEARARAAEWGLPYVNRPAKSALEPMFETEARAFLVLGGKGWALHDPLATLEFTPGMARVRIKRLQHHDAHPEESPDFQEDLLVRVSELQPGDVVLDATLGLAADATVCAFRVGPRGKVIGIEGSLPLYALVSEGLKRAGSTIEVRHGDAFTLMRAMPSRSVDCVILDPMFDRPKASSPAFEILRRYAVHEPLEAPMLLEARRLARRCVVVKGSRYGQDFKRLGLTELKLNKHLGPFVWARLDPLP